MTRSESIKLEAVKMIRQHLSNGSIPEDKALAKAVRSLAARMSISDGKLWIMKEGGLLEVLETAERIKEILLMLDKGMGHRA